MMDDRAITEYKLIIKVCDQKKCAEYDPFGLCYVDDCMSCPNSRIKIIREDGVVMRDDFKDNKNVYVKDKLWSYKRMLERDGVELFEKMYNVNFSKWQKKYLSKIFNKLKSKRTIKRQFLVKIKNETTHKNGEELILLHTPL